MVKSFLKSANIVPAMKKFLNKIPHEEVLGKGKS